MYPAMAAQGLKYLTDHYFNFLLTFRSRTKREYITKILF